MTDQRYIILDMEDETDRVVYDTIQDIITWMDHVLTDELDDPAELSEEAREDFLRDLGTVDRVLSEEARGTRSHSGIAYTSE